MMENKFQNNVILWQSDMPNFTRGFKTYSWKSSEQPQSYNSLTFWELSSEQKLPNFMEYMKLGLFLKGLPSKVLQCIVDAPGFFSDRMYLDLLHAKAELRSVSNAVEKDTVQPTSLLLQKLQRLQQMQGKTFWNYHLLNTFQKSFKYQLSLIQVPIGKVNKYSGWVRNSSAVGSKRSSGVIMDILEGSEVRMFVKLNFFKYFMSPNFDFDDLGCPAGTLLYPLLKESFLKGQPLNNEILQLLK